MIPVTFPQQNVVFAENQPEYQPLPAFRNETEVITKWVLSLEERKAIAEGADLWIRQMNFNCPLQPIYPTLEFPFLNTKDDETNKNP